MIHHIKRATRHLIFWSLIATAISLTVVRLLLWGIADYKADLSLHISKLIGAPLTIGHLRANMRGYSPELVLKDIEVSASAANAASPIQLKEVRVGINLFNALVTGDHLASSWVSLVGAKLTVKRKQDGSIAIVGLKASDEKPLWLLQGGKYEVLQSEISWQDELNPTKLKRVGMIDFSIVNKDQQHRLNILIKPPEQYGDELRLSMDLKGNLFEPSLIDGAVFVEGKNMKPAAWVEGQLPFAMKIGSGFGDFKLWTTLKHSQIMSMVADIQVQELKLTRPDKEDFVAEQVNTKVHWQHHDDQWRLDVPQFLLQTNDKQWPEIAFSVSANQTSDDVLHKAALFIKSLDLQNASTLLQFFTTLPKAASSFLEKSLLKGSVEQLFYFADLDAKHFAVNGGFNHLKIAPSGAIPGIENLTGRLKGTDEKGQLVLVTKDASMTTSGLFRDALSITKLIGTIGWQQTADEWLISSPHIVIDSPDIKTGNRFNLRIPKKEGKQPFLDLQMGFSAEDVTQVKRYLPVSVLKKSVVDWLDHAFIKGRVPKGGILFYGDLNGFPFAKGQGVFEARFDIDQMDISYLSDWPYLTELGGEVIFLQGGLQVDLNKGFSKKLKIKQATVVIPTLGESEHLLVQGKLETDILQGLNFLQDTPLNSSANSFLDAVDPQGATEVTLDLKLPLADGATAIVNGSAQLSKAKLKVKALDLGVSQITGALKFNEQGVYSQTITAQTLENPIKINIKSSDVLTTVNVTGHVGISDILKQFKVPGLELAEGSTDYQLKLQLPYDDSFPDLIINSNLAGVALDLPNTLAKTREQQRPFNLLFNLTNEALLPINIHYDNQMNAAVNYNIKQRAIESGNVLIGPGNVKQSQELGIRLEINRQRLDLKDWMGVALSFAQENNEAIASVVSSLKEVKVHSEHGFWEKADLGYFDLVFKPEEKHWAGNINATVAKGKFKIPFNLKGDDSMDFAMDLLNLNILKQLKFDNKVVSLSIPDTLPLLTLASQQTLWQAVDLGQLTVETERIPNGILFKRVELNGVDQKLALTGDWKIDGKDTQTHIKGKLTIPRAGEFFTKLDINKELVETNADVDFVGDWKGAPYQFSLASLQGQVDIDFRNGRILGIEPGFGRLLGILAISQWINHFQLDFSNVFEEGITFISIKGNFSLLGGKATTNDIVVDAIPAKITIVGHTDLINKTVDYGVSVVPKGADVVPVAGTIVGKLSDLIGRALTGKNQEGLFFGSQYLVKGGWGNVQLIPVLENDGLVQKTFGGITDFPWVKKNSE